MMDTMDVFSCLFLGHVFEYPLLVKYGSLLLISSLYSRNKYVLPDPEDGVLLNVVSGFMLSVQISLLR